jgi:hypothetical protein
MNSLRLVKSAKPKALDKDAIETMRRLRITIRNNAFEEAAVICDKVADAVMRQHGLFGAVMRDLVKQTGDEIRELQIKLGKRKS